MKRAEDLHNDVSVVRNRCLRIPFRAYESKKTSPLCTVLKSDEQPKQHRACSKLQNKLALNYLEARWKPVRAIL